MKPLPKSVDELARCVAFLWALVRGRIEINPIFHAAGYKASDTDLTHKNPHRRWTVQWWSWRRGYWDCVEDDLYQW